MTFHTVSFISELTGWIAGENGTIFKTDDGGLTWSNLSSNKPHTLFDIHMANENVGWVVGENGTILNTINGGKSWSTQESSTTNPLYSVSFTNSKRGWIVGDKGTILRTDKQGKLWTVEPSGTNQNLRSIFVFDPITSFAVGDLGLILGYKGRPDILIGINLWVVGIMILVVTGTIVIWRRFVVNKPSSTLSWSGTSSWKSGWKNN